MRKSLRTLFALFAVGLSPAAWAQTDLSSLLSDPETTTDIGTWTNGGVGTFHRDTWANVESTSGIKTPYYEYWIGQPSKLADATITTALTDMIPGEYTFTALVRLVDESSASTTISGATMYANSSTIDLATTGTTFTINNSMSAVYNTYSVKGSVGSDCALNVGFKVASANFNWIAFKNVKLTRENVDVEALKTALSTKISACSDYDNVAMSASVKTALSNAKSVAEKASIDDDCITAFERLISALAEAQTSAEAYATLKTALDTYATKATANLTSEGQTSYTSGVSAIQTAYTQGTYSNDEAINAVNTLASTYTNLLKTAYTSGSDMTDLIGNPSFDGNNDEWTVNATGTGWINRGIINETAQEIWTNKASTLSMDIYQVITGLPAGVYRITTEMNNAIAQNSEGNGYVNGAIGLYAQTSTNSSFAGITADAGVDANDNPKRVPYGVLITVKEGETLQLGAKNAYTVKAQWFNVDNFTLTYLGSDYSTIANDEVAVASMSAFTTLALKELSGAKVTSAATAASAINTFNANKTIANYEAVQNAMKNVYSDINLYYKSDKVSFNDWAVENGTYYLTYTTTTAVDLDQCYFTAYSVSVNGTKVTKTPLTGVVPASTPLLLTDTKASSTYCAMMSEAEGKTVTTDLKSSDGTITGDESTIYALGIGSTSNVLGWYLLKSGTTMTEGKCYLKVEASGVKFLGFSDDDATGINAVSNSTKNAARYNLSGQRVGNDYKGIVIENGKKYLVK